MSKFNKGDRIRAYGLPTNMNKDFFAGFPKSPRGLTGTIFHAEHTTVYVMLDDFENDSFLFMVKQIRKLRKPKEAESREFWISIHHDASIRLHSDREQASRCFLEGKLPSEVFHVREVRK